MKKKISLIVAIVISLLSLTLLLFGCAALACEHAWNNGEVTKEATCKEEGVITFTCELCGETKTGEVEKLTEHGALTGMNTCSICDKDMSTPGLEYTLSSDKNLYSVTSIGTMQGQQVIIASSYNGLPVTSIGDGAFYNCSSLTSIEIPDNVTSIGNYAFEDCSSLTSIEIPDSVTSIGDDAFDDCDSLKYNGYDNAYYLGNSANPYLVLVKAKSNGITSCNIHSSTRIVCYQAFYNCRSLTSIEIPNSVTSIGDGAFGDCDSLKYNGYDNAYYLGNSANPYLVLVKAKSNGITSCNIHSSTRIVCYQAFSYCSSLTSVEISNSVTSIGDWAFYGCSSLTSIEIPNSVTSIGKGAFSYCSGLTSIVIGDSVISIWDGAFYGCSSLTSIIVDKGNTVYHGAGNCIIETATKTLVVGCKSSIIPSDGSVTSIGDGAFYGCSSLTSIEISDSVTSIGKYAFYGCSSLTSVTFKNPNGWFVSLTEGATSGTDLTLTDLRQNATYLKSTYYNYYWYRR